MLISEKKPKAMMIYLTQNYQFSIIMKLNDQNIGIAKQMKILGTIITKKFSWEENCTSIVKKVNARKHLLQKVWSFGSNNEEMFHLWKVYCLSILEQSCVVWGGSLTAENVNDLERTQKTFCKLVMEEDYKNYNHALSVLGLTTLETRRRKLTLDFAKRSLADNSL